MPSELGFVPLATPFVFGATRFSRMLQLRARDFSRDVRANDFQTWHHVLVCCDSHGSSHTDSCEGGIFLVQLE